MEIKNDTIFQIKTRVLLYRNKKYFKIFRNILISNTLDIISSKNKIHMVSSPKIKESSNKGKEKIALWNIISKNIKKEKEIIDYDFNNYKNKNNEENEDEYFLEYLFNQTNTIQVNNLVYSYLNKIANIKLNKLFSISTKDKIPLINLMKIYLGLCLENFISSKRVNNTITGVRNSQKIIIKKISKRYKTNEKIITTKKDLFNEESKSGKMPLIKLRLDKKLIREKSTESNKKNNNSINQSSINEENEKKNNSKSEYNDVIYEQLKKSINKLTTKNKNINSKILYSSSFTRLFIGETDKDSIREKYLSNFEIKKERKLYKNKDKNLSSIYYKVFLNRLEQNKKNKLPILEKGVENIFLKFKKNQEIIDKFTRLKNKNINNNFNNLFYNKLKRLNKTATKEEKLNFFSAKKEKEKDNSILNRNSNQLEQDNKKNLNNLSDFKTTNKLIKNISEKKKLFDLNSLKLDNTNKTTKNSNYYLNKIKYNNKENEKLKFIYDYNHNSNLKKYLKQNIERNDSIKLIKDENAKAKSYIKKKIIINSNKDDDDDEYDYNNLILTNGNLTSRARGEFNSRFWNKEKLCKNKEQKDKNNVINFITREELFYEHI